MKSPQFNISFPESLHNDLARIASLRRISVAALVRDCVAAEVARITGKTYDSLQWGGGGRGAGRKPAQSAPPRRPVAADGEIKPRSRRAADAGTKKRRSSAA